MWPPYYLTRIITGNSFREFMLSPSPEQNRSGQAAYPRWPMPGRLAQLRPTLTNRAYRLGVTLTKLVLLIYMYDMAHSLLNRFSHHSPYGPTHVSSFNSFHNRTPQQYFLSSLTYGISYIIVALVFNLIGVVASFSLFFFRILYRAKS